MEVDFIDRMQQYVPSPLYVTKDGITKRVDEYAIEVFEDLWSTARSVLTNADRFIEATVVCGVVFAVIFFIYNAIFGQGVGKNKRVKVDIKSGHIQKQISDIMERVKKEGTTYEELEFQLQFFKVLVTLGEEKYGRNMMRLSY